MSNVTLYIVRRMKGLQTIADSAPCLDCFHKMLALNVKTIVYSSVNGNIVKQRLVDYKPKVYSLGRHFINSGYETIYRDSAPQRVIQYDDDDNVTTSETDRETDTDTETSSIISDESSRTARSSVSSTSTTQSRKQSTHMRQSKKKDNSKFISRMIKKNKKFSN